MNEKDFLFSLTGEKIKTLMAHMNSSPHWMTIYLDDEGKHSLHKRINTGNGYKDYNHLIPRELMVEVFNKHPELHEERIKYIETGELKILKSFETHFEIKSSPERASISNIPLKNELVNNLFKEIDTIIVLKEPYFKDPFLLEDYIVGKWIKKYRVDNPSVKLENEVYKGKIDNYEIHYSPCSGGYCSNIYYFKFNKYNNLISYLENLKIQIDIFTILKADKNETSIMIEKYDGDKVLGDKKQETNIEINMKDKNEKIVMGDEIGGDKMNSSVKAGRDAKDIAISSNKNKSNIVNGIIITVIGGIILLLIKYYFHLI